MKTIVQEKLKKIEPRKSVISKTPKVFITGDCHGDFSRFFQFIDKEKDIIEQDIMICLGDFGANYYLNKRDRKNKEQLSKLPFIFLIVQGNHEQYPKYINTYKEKHIDTEMITGDFYIEEEFPNLLFFKNGNEYRIKDKFYLVLGGAYSVDKFFRLEKGFQWFSHEQMSLEEMTEIIKKIKNKPNKYDCVLSHTCPYNYIPTHLFLPYINQDLVDNSTELFLNDINNLISYNIWFCGHYHNNEQLWDKGYMLYDEIKEIL